jgi:hypothetical protein
MISGRRGLIRRETDRKDHPYVDVYDHYVLLAILLIVLLSVFDTYFTLFHIEMGAREVNPFMDVLIGYGNLHFFVAKYVLTALGLFLLCIHKNLLIVRIILRLIFCLYFTVFVYHVFLVLSI